MPAFNFFVQCELNIEFIISVVEGRYLDSKMKANVTAYWKRQQNQRRKYEKEHAPNLSKFK